MLLCPNRTSWRLALMFLLLGSIWFTAPAAGQALLDPATQPRFVNLLPNPLDPGFTFHTVSLNHFEIATYQIDQSLGLVDPMTHTPFLTHVWGYGYDGDPASATYPGRSFVVRSNQQITVRWANHLPSGPLPAGKTSHHLLPVDETLHWAEPPDWPQGGVPIAVHVHGGHSRSDSDGLPDAWFTPQGATGRLFNPLYTYDNDQEGATLWYHDHGLGITRLNVYAGLAGFYILRDENEYSLIANNVIPSGRYEIPFVIQDRMFTADGQLFYPSDPDLAEVAEECPQNMDDACEAVPDPTALPEFFGNFILVNGQAWPRLPVDGRQYRFRILNGSDSRFYNVWLTPGTSMGPAGPGFAVIGNDQGFLNKPIFVSQLLIGPGERYDVVVDFTGFEGQRLIMRNNAHAPFPKGEPVDPSTQGEIMAFDVASTPVTDPVPPLSPGTHLRPLIPPVIPPSTAGLRVRKLMLLEATDAHGRLQPLLGTVTGENAPDGTPLDGTLLWHETTTETPMLDSTEVWEIHNATVDAHPIHLHLVRFLLLGRQKYNATVVEKLNSGDMDVSLGGALRDVRYIGMRKGPNPDESGWKDTVIMYPGQVTRIVATFDRPGEYVWHCHILSHEDHEMMRRFVVLDGMASLASRGAAAGQGTPAAVLEPNQPNPFNPMTRMSFSLAAKGRAELAIFNVRGERVRTLVDRVLDAGPHTELWNGTDDRGNAVASGIYYSRLVAGGIQVERTMTLVR